MLGCPRIGDTVLGGPYNKDYSFFGLYWGVPLFMKSTMSHSQRLGKSLEQSGLLLRNLIQVTVVRKPYDLLHES